MDQNSRWKKVTRIIKIIASTLKYRKIKSIKSNDFLFLCEHGHKIKLIYGFYFILDF